MNQRDSAVTRPPREGMGRGILREAWRARVGNSIRRAQEAAASCCELLHRHMGGMNMGAGARVKSGTARKAA